MIKIAIVEDEAMYAKQLEEFLHQYEAENHEAFDITIYSDGDQIVNKYKSQFDIILMDVEMKFMDGMSAAEEIRKMDSEVVIIFITNMAQYAIRGYAVDALDYVLKPVSYFAFSQRLNRAIERMKKREAKVIMVNIKGGMVRINIANIYYIESQGHTLILHTILGDYETTGKMKEMDEKLQDILDFADIGDFVYQPVKTYSSGMFVRLAFALAINVEPEILIVDEALSVGDVFFQSKCYRRMEEIRQKGTTILMVTHDMGSIIKYCDKVVLLNKGNFVAEGAPGHMVDLYKKILAGQMEGLEAAKDVDSDFSGETAEKEQKEKTYQLPHGKLMKDSLTINSNRTEYGDGRAEIYDLGLFDQRGNLTNLLLKGEEFTIKEKIRFAAPIQSPIFTYTIKDKKGTDLTGTNTMFEGTDIKPVKAGDEYEVSFTQKMTLQGGEYLLSMSCTGFEQGEHTVYHRLYDVANITVISNKNTVGVYDMESAVQAVKIERNHD